MDDWLVDLATQLEGVPEWQKIAVLGLATFFVSEDLTTIGSGVLVSQGLLAPLTAFWGCFLGIFFGDGLLYLIGYVVGRPAMKLPILRRLLSPGKVLACERWFEENGIAVVIISRFLPGTRLPTYFAAGVMRSKAPQFLFAAAIATAVWTPLLLVGAWFFGDRLTNLFEMLGANKLLVIPISFALLFGAFYLFSRCTDWKWRRRFQSRLFRMLRWEFWPIGVLYIPIAIQNLFLILRYRRLTLPLLCNPAMENGGMIGESKTAVMDSFELPNPFIPAYLLLRSGAPHAQRLAQLRDWMDKRGMQYPVILKPDAGQRGYGVRLIRSESDALNYLALVPIPVIAQEFAPGPYEFGVYYTRIPGQERGSVSGITGKEFPRIVGDGSATIEELILRLSCAMGRVHIFLSRFKDRLHDVLPAGESMVLVNAGNHCQGTIFLDHSHLITPQLSARFDQLAQSIQGLYIGRFDVRATDLESFRGGDAFKIVEINGATAEPSQIYDPKYSVFNAWRELAKHWSLVWKIGAINHRSGMRAARLIELWRAFSSYRRTSRYHLDAN